MDWTFSAWKILRVLGVRLSMSRICPENLDPEISDCPSVAADVRLREEPGEEEDEEEEEDDNDNEGDDDEGYSE
jgi:hypothetical protein